MNRFSNPCQQNYRAGGCEGTSLPLQREVKDSQKGTPKIQQGRGKTLPGNSRKKML